MERFIAITPRCERIAETIFFYNGKLNRTAEDSLRKVINFSSFLYMLKAIRSVIKKQRSTISSIQIKTQEWAIQNLFIIDGTNLSDCLNSHPIQSIK